MGALYDYLKESQPDKVKETREEWLVAGLMHDVDYEQFTDGDYTDHGKKSVEILKKENLDLPESVYQAIKAHCYNLHPDWEPKTLMDWSLFIMDSLTGLIVATTLVLPSKKLAEVTVERIQNRFKEKAFARGSRREDIATCEDRLGIPLAKFFGINLKAMQKISDKLGL